MPLWRSMAGIAAAFVLAAAATPALSDTSTTTPTTSGPTTTLTTATAPVTTTMPTNPVTTAVATTSATTGAATVSTPTVSRTSATALSAWPTASGCPVGAVALLVPHRAPVLVGPDARAEIGSASLSRLVYPADDSIVAASSVSLGQAGCTARGPRSAHALLRSLSLFGGAVTAVRLQLTIGRTDAAVVNGLTIAGVRHSAITGVPVWLRRWGYLVVKPGPIATGRGSVAISAVAVHLVHAHAGLPAGTVVLVLFAGLPARQVPGARARPRRRRAADRAMHKPLKVTPPLAPLQYVFPIAGAAEYVDTYGAFRSDVPGKWHHGDDIFAPLGTPVLAVASGTINRVGWEGIGGWRLWLRDNFGDEFYYAHLSGYAPTDFRSNQVRAGEVIGFVGNTGDAFTTSPHLHFEIHPRPLLHLGYDGGVDPTSYLTHWVHLARVHAPAPARPTLPSQPASRREARYVWRELLAARHLIRQTQRRPARSHVKRPSPGTPQSSSSASAAARPAKTHPGRGSTTMTALLVAALSLALVTATLFAARKRTAHTAKTRTTSHAQPIRERLRRLRRTR